jgi:hypothetical protein
MIILRKRLMIDVLKRKYWNALRLKDMLIDYLYDFKRYKKYSATFGLNSSNKIEGKIIAHYHVIEKGFSFKDTKIGFAKPVVKDLISLLKQYTSYKYSSIPNQINHALDLINRYIIFHKENNYDISDIEIHYENLLSCFSARDTNRSDLGTKYLNSFEYKEYGRSDFKRLMEGRLTTRQFKGDHVAEDLITEILDIAKNTPSACNRQPVKVHVFNGLNDVNNILKFQSGNRGFGDKIPALFIVSFDIGLYEGSFERSQGYVDGGLFCMSLMNAIHYCGLGYVALNWCSKRAQDLSLRNNVDGFGCNESIVMLIGFGEPDDTIKSPQSIKRTLDEFVTYH